jgi:hypothetical protein
MRSRAGAVGGETPPGFNDNAPPAPAPTPVAPAPAGDFPQLTDLTKPTRSLDGWWNGAVDRMNTAGDKPPEVQLGTEASGGTAYTTLDDVNVSPTDRTEPKLDPTPSALLWLRKIRLVVYGPIGQDVLKQETDQSWLPQFLKPTLGYQMPKKEGATISGSDGIDLSQLRCVFQLKKMINGTPNILYAKIYNLSKKTIDKVKQYHRVQLAAGYKANYGMIFDGAVALYVVGRDNPVDTYLELFAGDQEGPLSSNTIALTWPANTKPEQKAKDMINGGGLTVGHVDTGTNQQPTLRSSTFIGMARNGLRDIINASQADMLVENGVVHIIPWTGYMPGEIIELSPSTGLVNIPKVTPDGIECQCLLNPKLRLGGLFKLDSKWLSNLPFEPGSKEPFQSLPRPFEPTGPGFQRGSASISPTGTYKIAFMTHYGDSRGNPWYTDLVGIAAGADGSLLAKIQSTAFKRGPMFSPGVTTNTAPT